VSSPNLLLTSKLHIPSVRPELVARPRLVERLNRGLPRQSGSQESLGFARKVTLVSAPAGFGKTTLISGWIHAQSGGPSALPVAWLNLDEKDNDPARFFSYFVATLQSVDPHIGQAALAMMQSPQPPPPDLFLTSLVNDIDATSYPFVLVIDDYHLISAQAIGHLHPRGPSTALLPSAGQRADGGHPAG